MLEVFCSPSGAPGPSHVISSVSSLLAALDLGSLSPASLDLERSGSDAIDVDEFAPAPAPRCTPAAAATPAPTPALPVPFALPGAHARSASERRGLTRTTSVATLPRGASDPRAQDGAFTAFPPTPASCHWLLGCPAPCDPRTAPAPIHPPSHYLHNALTDLNPPATAALVYPDLVTTGFGGLGGGGVYGISPPVRPAAPAPFCKVDARAAGAGTAVTFHLNASSGGAAGTTAYCIPN